MQNINSGEQYINPDMKDMYGKTNSTKDRQQFNITDMNSPEGTNRSYDHPMTRNEPEFLKNLGEINHDQKIALGDHTTRNNMTTHSNSNPLTDHPHRDLESQQYNDIGSTELYAQPPSSFNHQPLGLDDQGTHYNPLDSVGHQGKNTSVTPLNNTTGILQNNNLNLHQPETHHTTLGQRSTQGIEQNNLIDNNNLSRPGKFSGQHPTTVKEAVQTNIDTISNTSQYGSSDESNHRFSPQRTERPVADKNAFIHEQDRKQFLPNTLDPAERAKQLGQELKARDSQRRQSVEDKTLKIGDKLEYKLD